MWYYRGKERGRPASATNRMVSVEERYLDGGDTRKLLLDKSRRERSGLHLTLSAPGR